MKGKYRKDRPHDFTVAYWKEVQECETNEQVSIVLYALTSAQVGVLTFDLAARALEGSPSAFPLARITETWPNAQEQPFEVFLYQMAYKLARMVEQVRIEQSRPARR